MSAVLAAEIRRPVRIPTYRNEHVEDFQRWYRANEPALSEYFQQLVDIEPTGCDFFEFAVLQQERELFRARQNAFNDAPFALSQAAPLVRV